MGISEVAYNIASNRPARYRDDPEPVEDDHENGIDLESDPYATLDELGNQSQASPRPQKLAQQVWHRVRTTGLSIWRWTEGPDPPRMWSIKPIFPSIQEAPLRLLDTYVSRQIHRFWLLILLYTTWLLVFILVLRRSTLTEEIPGYGSPVKLSCGTSYWGKDNACGLDGQNCLPFSNQTLAFRCAGNCVKTWALEPRAVGEEEVIYKPLVIGGGTPADTTTTSSGIYRSDSFICAAAIHAGLITNSQGGCGVLELVGEHANYIASDRHGVSTTAFNSSFPSSYRFLPSATSSSKCRDLRWPLLAFTVTSTVLLALFTTSPAIFFFSAFVSIFLHVALVSDPPQGDYYSLLSLALGQLLPSAFIMYVVYLYVVERSLLNLRAQFEKAILWLGGCWIGALNNETFDQRIPIQRLTPHDIAQQPGAVPALLIIVFTILGIAFGQAWAIRIEGRMRKYLLVYGLFVAGLLILLAIPGMHLRIHHYILGLLLLPGTAMQNRPSLLYQGLLVGLFINGVARWGYASIIATAGDLQGDAQLGSALPVLLAPAIMGGNITFSWAWPPPDTGVKLPNYDGVSVLANDVERFRSSIDSGEDEKIADEKFSWQRNTLDHDRPEYFRFAYMLDGRSQDYTKAGVWEADGRWRAMRSGPSK